MTPLRNLLRAALNLLGCTALLALMLLAYGTLPNRWYHVLAVTSGSMQPTFYPGDLIIITPPPRELRAGMILTLRVGSELVTHRLVAVDDQGHIITKGDANAAPDYWQDNTTVSVVGQYRARVPLIGYVLNLASTLRGGNSTGAWFSDTEQLSLSTSSGQWITPSPTPSGDGTSIRARLTAAGFRDPTSGVSGQICSENNGNAAAENLTITLSVEAKTGLGKFQPLPDAILIIQASAPLPPKQTNCQDYHLEFIPLVGETQYRLLAQVTISNHSGWLPGSKKCPGPAACPFGPQEKASFSLPPDEQIFSAPLLPTASPTALEIIVTPRTEASPTLTPGLPAEPDPTLTCTPLPIATETPSLPPPTETPVPPPVQPQPEPSATQPL